MIEPITIYELNNSLTINCKHELQISSIYLYRLCMYIAEVKM